MADGKLTLNRVITGTVSSSKGDKVVVEVKRKRVFGQDGVAVPVGVQTSSPDANIDSDKASAIQELLDKAKRTEEENKASADALAQANKTRDFLAAEKRREDELKQQISQAVVPSDSDNAEKEGVRKEWKKSDDIHESGRYKKENSEDDDKAKKVAKSGDKFGRHKLTLSKLVINDDDSDDDIESDGVATGPETYRRFSHFKKRKIEKKPDTNPAQKIVREVGLHSTITVKDLADRMSEKSTAVIKELMKLGIMATINQVIDADTAEIVIHELGHKVKRIDENYIENMIKTPDSADDVVISRPPVITIMGHVDHGKTSLLDAMRSTDVASRESGGITQHIGAYEITRPDGRMITFIDTPGHEAFSSMRARGASVTDIVVLVVSAGDSIMPQTIESISHTKAAGVPMIIAINKIDLPEANPQKVKTDLLQHGVIVEEMGGETLCVEVSAKQKLNLDKLEDAILLQAEMIDLKVGKNRPAEGIIIESKMEKGLGVVATVLIQKGTLKKGDVFVVGEVYGRVREMFDDRGAAISEATPSTPVAVLGFSEIPLAGDEFIVTPVESQAKELAAYRKTKAKEKEMLERSKSTLENMFNDANSIKVGLSVILKMDVAGSGEAIIGTLEKLNNEKVHVKVVHSAVGGINESDVNLARSVGAMIVAFNVRANGPAKDLAKAHGIEIRYYSVIYNILDDVKAILEGKLEPIVSENFIGYADVLQIFKVGKSLTVAGCRVSDGVVKRNCKCRIIRDDVVIFEGNLGQLKHGKDDVKEAATNTECGISFESYNDLQVGDKIECFEIVKTAAKL